MIKQEISNQDKCPITFAMEIFGDKWSLVILRDMFFKNKKYYSEFLNSAEKIATNILANRLQKMESVGLISKTKDSQNLSKFIYKLTDTGKDLLPVILDIIEWSSKYNPQPETTDSIILGAPDNLLKKLNNDREGLINEILSKLI